MLDSSQDVLVEELTSVSDASFCLMYCLHIVCRTRVMQEVCMFTQNVFSSSPRDTPASPGPHPAPSRSRPTAPWHLLREYKTFASHAISLLFLSSCGDAIRILFPKVAWTSYLFGVQVSIAITEQKLLHIDLSANSDSAIIGGPVGALAFEHKTFQLLNALYFEV